MAEADRNHDEHDDQEEQEEQEEEQARRSRDTGGDAEAAAPIEDREAVATDTDDPSGDDDRE